MFFVHELDFFTYLRAFIIKIVVHIEGEIYPFMFLGPEFLASTVNIIANQIICCLNYLFCGSVVLFEPDNLCPRAELFEV